MQGLEHNHGSSMDLDMLVGLRHKDTHAISAHGAFIAARGPNTVITTCVLFDGVQFLSCCSKNELDSQIQNLLDRRWVWMTKDDVTVACFGMGTPGADQPFWDPGWRLGASRNTATVDRVESVYK